MQHTEKYEWSLRNSGYHQIDIYVAGLKQRPKAICKASKFGTWKADKIRISYTKVYLYPIRKRSGFNVCESEGTVPKKL